MLPYSKERRPLFSNSTSGHVGAWYHRSRKKMATLRNFTDLLQQAKQLTADIETGEELPPVKKNLQQICQIAC